MMWWAYYDNQGAILSVFGAPSLDAIDPPEGLFVEVDADTSDETHYIHQGEAKARESLDTSFLVEDLSLTFSALPAGTVIEVGGSSAVADDTPTVVEFDVPGTYTVELYPPPQYLDETLEVTVG